MSLASAARPLKNLHHRHYFFHHAKAIIWCFMQCVSYKTPFFKKGMVFFVVFAAVTSFYSIVTQCHIHVTENTALCGGMPLVDMVFSF